MIGDLEEIYAVNDFLTTIRGVLFEFRHIVLLASVFLHLYRCRRWRDERW